MKSDAAEIAAHFETKNEAEDDYLMTITFTRDHSWLDAMQMLQDLQESGDLQDKQRIHWCIWPNAPIIEEVATLMIDTMEYFAEEASRNNHLRWEQFVFQDLDQSNEDHCRILSAVCRLELFESLWVGGRNDQEMSIQTATDLSHSISKNCSIAEISVFLKLSDECFPILGQGLENARNLTKLSLHLNLSDTIYNGSSPLALEFLIGIGQNQHLQQLDLDGFPIQWLCSLFQALEQSPIKTLCLKKCQWKEPKEENSASHYGPQLWTEAARYLSSKECSLEILDLSYPASDLDVSRLISCLEINKSLTTLRLRHAGLVATDLMELLVWTGAKYTSLSELDLRGNSVSLLELSNLVFYPTHVNDNRMTGFEQNNAHPSSSQLSRINLDGNRNNHIWPEKDGKQIQRVLLWMLDRFSCLVFLGDRFARSYLCDPLVQHAMDMNRIGMRKWRTIISTTTTATDASNDTLSMALWPYMLERPTKMLSSNSSRRGSVTYRLLMDGIGMMMEKQS